MNYLESRKLIENFVPHGELEEKDKEMFIQCFDAFGENLYKRENLAAHFTSSAIVFNKTHDKLLYAYHNIFKSYSWLGGHNDGDFDFLNVALKEIKEESGLNNVEVMDKNIISIECLYVPSHMKRGIIVPHHLHLNVSYVFVADENDNIRIKEDENSAIKWIKLDELDKYVHEPVMMPVYNKIIDRAMKKYNWR